MSVPETDVADALNFGGAVAGLAALGACYLGNDGNRAASILEASGNSQQRQTKASNITPNQG